MFLSVNVLNGQTNFYLYGGKNHQEFIGCLNCNQFDKNSIWNELGKYGNKLSSKSIWNSYGTFGSEYSSYSPWNKYYTAPPIVVDPQGNFYGYFTLNEHKSKRAEFDLALTVYRYHDLIRDDISKKWYDKIFD